MRRRFLPFTLLALLLTAAWAGAKLTSPRVFVNGVPLREPAITRNGTTYAPLRAVAEALHRQVLHVGYSYSTTTKALTPSDRAGDCLRLFREYLATNGNYSATARRLNAAQVLEAVVVEELRRRPCLPSTSSFGSAW